MAGVPVLELPPAYVYESNVHVGNILVTLNEQRKCGLLCDISIIVQKTEFKAHKAILASCSSYFNRIITDPANVSHNIVLELSSISKIGMESLLEFAYTSKLTVNVSNIDDVICAARELEFKNIEFSCLTYLKQQLLSGKPSSCFLGSQEATTHCGNSTISRQGEQYKQIKPSSDCCLDKKPCGKLEKGLPLNDCPLLSRLSLCSRKKSSPTSAPAEDCRPYNCNEVVVKPESCEQMSQEQHQAMIKKILEQHGLEPATVDEKAMEVGATETTSGVTSQCHVQQGYRPRPMCPGREKRMCASGYLSPAYNSDTDEAGSLDGESDNSSCSMKPCGKLRKQPAIKLPFTMEQITSMPRSELHDVLTRASNLTQEQICAIHEIRRRGKNRIAAQRCRKRKMECIQSLVAEIATLRAQHAQLMDERRQAREQAIKLSDKFRAKCEKFFKCDKKGCLKKRFCSGGVAAAPAVPEEQQPIVDTDDLTEHAQRAHKLCEKLKEAPTEDLPPCAVLSGENNVWPRQCMSPPLESEDIVCTIVDDSNDASYQACSPASAYVMSPSQGLRSDFGNIHISPPSAQVDATPTSACRPRTSVVQHTSLVESHSGQSFPCANNTRTIYPHGVPSTQGHTAPPDTQMTDLTQVP